MFVALGYHLDSICRLAVQRLLGGTDLSGGFSGFAQASEALLQAEWARAQLVQIQAEQEIALARYRMAQLAVLGSAAVSSQPGHSPQRRIAERVQPLEVICPEKLAEDVMICRKSRKVCFSTSCSWSVILHRVDGGGTARDPPWTVILPTSLSATWERWVSPYGGSSGVGNGGEGESVFLA